jgi:N6-adenosine-specific RNA methylase IME4
VKPCRVLCADPPWSFGDSLPGPSRGAVKNYKVLNLNDIKRFPLPKLADDALLFLWRVAAMQEEALAVVRAWGFVPKSEMVWIKTAKDGAGTLAFGMGRYVRHCHEVCLIASRGRGVRLIRNHSVRSVFEAPLSKHSEKPEQFYRLVETLAEGPYVELFARKNRVGWECYGDELTLSHSM